MRRPRRNRKSSAVRAMIQETPLAPRDLICPYFVLEGEGRTVPVASMPGVERYSVDRLVDQARRDLELGIPAVILFPVVPCEKKDPVGSEALNPEGSVPRAIVALKQELPELCVIADVALDPYTSHGHDGLMSGEEILNDESVELLGKMSLMLAQAGADMVAPSDMMDGRIAHIRDLLDRQEQRRVSIMAYSAKYASAFYGPFREALSSAPRSGDKKTYQMDPANSREAVLECLLDEEEGADMLMVKPGLPYLDVIARIRQETTLPLAAYMVSGEYSMIMAAAQNGWLDGDRALFEAHIALKRAGADLILTYAARTIAEKLQQQQLTHF